MVATYWRRTRGAGMDTMQCGRGAFIDAHRVRLDATAHGMHVRLGHSEAAVAWELCEGHARLCFVRRRQVPSWTGMGQGGGLTAGGRMPAHGAYSARRMCSNDDAVA
jgi:hypothetical protein